MRIAIIGSGIAGLTCAHLLSRKHEVTVFEADARIGGHTHTVKVQVRGQAYAVDTGFIVYNDWTYPNFIRLLDQLKVPTRPTEMSFSVHDRAAAWNTTATTSTPCSPSAATCSARRSGACCATSCVSTAR